jgi:3-dehydroquinate synthase
MRTIQVNTKENPYRIHVEHGLLTKFSALFIKQDQGQRWIIVTQPNINKLYGQSLQKLLDETGFNVEILTIPVGERAKTLAQIEILYRQLLDLRCDRSTVLIALGGGVIGDVTGFLAATFMRGIQYIQVPTTLLAMIDSAIGGKTGVNLPQGKNLVGSIYQPQTVVIDPEFLNTLPVRELVSGFSEMLKYGLIKDLDFFKLLNDNKFILELENPAKIEIAIAKSCEIKAEIVSKDERELGLRRILNFGHTIGHALETYYEYDKLKHGEAVAYGILCSSWISFQKGMISEEEWVLIETTVRKLPLPQVSLPNSQQILKSIRYDKKNRFGKLCFILLNGIGNAVESRQVTDKDIVDSLKIL